jgi:hypothetical protein
LVGGLAVVGLLAATEGREILLGLTDQGAAAGDGVEVCWECGVWGGEGGGTHPLGLVHG